MSKSVPTPEKVFRACHEPVRSWLLAKAKAETLREQVDKIWSACLAEMPLYDQYTGERIFDHSQAYAAPRGEWQKVFEVADRFVRDRVPGAATLPPDHCPALTAEHQATLLEAAIVDAAGPVLGITRDKLLNAGLDMYEKFVDHIVKLVVNYPGFKDPAATPAPLACSIA